MEPKYLLICNNCYHKIFTDGSGLNLVEVKTAPVPLRADGLNKESKNLPKKYRCPSCGYILKTTKLAPPPPKEEEKNKDDEPKDLYK